MNLSEFLGKVNSIEDGINTGHNIPNEIKFYYGDKELIVKKIEPDMLPCICWVGVNVELVEENDYK